MTCYCPTRGEEIPAPAEAALDVPLPPPRIHRNLSIETPFSGKHSERIHAYLYWRDDEPPYTSLQKGKEREYKTLRGLLKNIARHALDARDYERVSDYDKLYYFWEPEKILADLELRGDITGDYTKFKELLARECDWNLEGFERAIERSKLNLPHDAPARLLMVEEVEQHDTEEHQMETQEVADAAVAEALVWDDAIDAEIEEAIAREEERALASSVHQYAQLVQGVS